MEKIAEFFANLTMILTGLFFLVLCGLGGWIVWKIATIGN